MLKIMVTTVVIAATAHPIHAQPSDRDLLLTGLLLTPPTYVVGVALHEGSHALAAKLVGADVVSLTIIPGRDPQTGAFHFGLTRVEKLRGRGSRAFFYVAPKLTDSILLAGFAALVLTRAWPDNRYGQLALTVAATGLWVDFAKDVLTFSKFNDITKLGNLYCVNNEWRRLPARIVYGALASGLGYLVYRGYQRTFVESDTASMKVSSDIPTWSIGLWAAQF
jgi:hypothetical protein